MLSVPFLLSRGDLLLPDGAQHGRIVTLAPCWGGAKLGPILLLRGSDVGRTSHGLVDGVVGALCS